MERYNGRWTLAVVFGVLAVTVPDGTAQSVPGTCEPYIYCNGESLDAVTTLAGRTIYCDIIINPTERCCLPQAKHFVCYDIIVDGQFLSYDQSGRSPSTDFTALCQAIAEKRGGRAGKYSSVITAEGGGYLAYRRGGWVNTQARSQHIKHLACEVI